ncbi:MAG: CDP-alcohol phosphatidyltransferase family protein [Actinomycetota bacterium]|nr:CDP-alcohol phosphatidyltransferase family protein [Actinomycetota bacterium]
MRPSELFSDRVLTVPNLLSFARLLGVPLFLWFLLGPRWDVAAIAILVVAGVTDYLDGMLARRLGQTSKLGALLDPLADRLYIISTLVAFVVRDVIPLWLAALILGRDVILGLCLPVLRHYRYPPLQVHYLGKAATFNLLYAFPLLLIAVGDGPVAALAQPIGYAFAAWGVGLYLWSGVLYLLQVRQLVGVARREARNG